MTKSSHFGLIRILGLCLALFYGLPVLLAFPALAADESLATVKIASGVSGLPGGVAWSTDGKRLAYIGGSVHIYEVDGGKDREVSLKGPAYLAWQSDNELLVVSKDEGDSKLLSVDADNGQATALFLDMDPEAVYPIGEDQLLVVESRIADFAIGTSMNHRVVLYSRKKAVAKELYSFGKVFPARELPTPFLKGWLHAGLNPVDGGLFILDHHKPPIGRAYAVVSSLDLATGQPRVITNNGWKMEGLSASWSPDGRRLALTGGDAYMNIIDRNGTVFFLGEGPAVYPSWNPRGSQIFAGGVVVDSDGKKRKSVMSADPESIGSWSPDGTSLAVVSHGVLSLVRGFTPYFVAPDRPYDPELAHKAGMLRELLSSGLLSDAEYGQRIERLFRDEESGK